MESRVARSEKYYQDDYNTNINTNTSLSRSDRNSRLYRQVYGKYEDLDNLPMDDNSDEIDMERLKELVSNNGLKQDKTPPNGYNLDILEQKKRDIDQNKVYDINKLLEKAKYENNKLKEPENKVIRKSRDILSTLESTELSVDEIRKACEKYDDVVSNKKIVDDMNDKTHELTMTREIKYQTRQISVDPLIEQVIPDNDVALDLLSDLKPTGDTIVTEPIKEETIKEFETMPFFESKTDTSDIDVIKESKKIDDDFFTSSYQFTKKDFSDDDFFDEEPKSHNVLKVILLILAIIVFAGVIFYFVMNYGIGV